MTGAVIARHAGLLAAALLGAPAPAAAQDLARRVAGAPDGPVSFTFAGRPRAAHDESDQRDGGVAWACDSGPIRITLQVGRHQVTDIRAIVGARARSTDSLGVDLGIVGVREATAYLIALAREGRSPGAALFAASIADSVTLWPDLLALARDRQAPAEARRQAVFWVSQAAGTAATQGLVELAGETADREVREAAVFALSQRPREQSVPALIGLARSSRDPETRRRAIFWLGQTDDPRALALFEEILSR